MCKLLILLSVILLSACDRTESISEHSNNKSEPYLVASKDGCDVYTFYAANTYHYFTRCGSAVTTEKNYTDNCGKSCKKDKQESIRTERK